VPLGVIGGHLWRHFGSLSVFSVPLKNSEILWKEKNTPKQSPKCENVSVFVGPNGLL